MKKRFIVTTNPTTVEQDEVFQRWINDQGFGWWHWLNQTWLLIDFSGRWTASEIRDRLLEGIPKLRCLVIELNESGDTWAGFGPTAAGQDMFSWIRSAWKAK